MATDGPDPKPCDQEVYEDGEVIFITHTIPSNAMERWVKKIAKVSGERVDWYFAGGRAVIKAIGDLDKINDAMIQLMPEHDALFKIACKEYDFETFPPRYKGLF